MEGFIERLLSSIAEFGSGGVDPVVFKVFVRVGAAAILCGLIGFERQAHNKDAGIRTYSMVGIGAALFTFLSIEAFGALADTSRVAAQVVSGIGFLGAGLIFRQGVTVRGMTTAAGLWAAAAVGMAAGAGQLTAAITVSIIILAVLWVTGTFVGRVKARSVRRAHNKITLVLAGPGEISSLHKIFDHLAPDVARPIPEAGHWAIISTGFSFESTEDSSGIHLVARAAALVTILSPSDDAATAVSPVHTAIAGLAQMTAPPVGANLPQAAAEPDSEISAGLYL